MDLELSGKTAVVTGGSKGIGLATVRTLIAEGMRVVTGSRTVTPALAGTGASAGGAIGWECRLGPAPLPSVAP